MSIKKLITQHRRGTKTEWENTLEVPKDGEVIIEKGSTPKIKVGNGNTSFTDLPYITDEVEDKIEEQKTRLNNLITDGSLEPAAGSWEAEVADIRVVGDKVFDTAGDAVRAVYDDVKDFVGKSAVNGLEYNTEGDYMLYLTSNGNRVGNGVEVKGGTGTSDTSIVSLEVETEEEFALTMEQKAYIRFRFTSKIDGISTGTFQYQLLNNLGGILESGNYKQTSEFIDLDITKHLKEGSNIIRLRCEDVYSNYRMMEFKITLIDFRLDTTEDLIQLVDEDTFTFTCKALGNVRQTLHITLRDTSEEFKTWIDFETSEVPYNTAQPYTFDLTNISNRGVYELEAYSVTTIGDDELFSNSLNHKLILTKGSTAPLVAAVCDETEVTTADRLVIPFRVFDPNAISSPSDCVKLSISILNKGQYEELYSPEYRNNLNLDLIQYWYLPELPAGNIRLSIRYYPEDANSNGYDDDLFYEEVYDLEVADTLKPTLVPGYNVNLDAYGKSNSDIQTRNTWISEISNASGTGAVTKVVGNITGCNWTNNGWLTDTESGTPYLRLFGDARLELDYAPFSRSNYDIYAGITLELDFAIREVNTRNRNVFECLGNSGAGISATCDTLGIYSTNSDGLRTNYKENERLKLSLVITPPYVYENTSKDFIKNDPQFLNIYVNGVLSSTTRYIFDRTSLDDGTNPYFYHDGKFIFGDSSCTLDIYSIRIYSRALTHNEILRNYITGLGADKNTILSKNAYYEFDSNNQPIDIVYGLTKYDEIKDIIPTILFTGEMPPKKGDKRTVYMDFINPFATDRNFANWYKDKGYEVGLGIPVEIDVQGTSSAGYVRKNWKIKMKKDKQGNKLSSYQHMENQIPSNVFCLKVDYAEATGTHNTQNANFIETLYKNLPKLPAQEDDARVRTTIAGFPCVIFERLTQADEPVFSSKSNFNFDKGSEEAFGFTEDYDVESWEFCNNDSRCIFKDDFNVDEYWLNDFEPRYTSYDFDKLEELEEEIEDNKESAKESLKEAYDLKISTLDPESEEYKQVTDKYNEDLAAINLQENEFKYSSDYDTLITLRSSMISRFKELFDWVRSTDTTKASNTLLESPVIYNGVEYLNDSVEYRIAKFANEFSNYFDLDYASIYYVYTFFALMTDQRAKNMFLTRWGDKWYPYFYDNDTCFGIDNSGKISFDYYNEDTDIGVYNGRESVLWTNFRTAFKEKIKTTYNSLRSTLKYDTLVNQFIEEGSSKWTPSIYNEDAEYKYITMARPENATLDSNNRYQVDVENLKQVRGTGDLHLKYFLSNRFDYCDSKWRNASYEEDRIEVRPYIIEAQSSSSASIVPPSPRIKLTSYTNMYGGIQYRTNGTFQSYPLVAGVEKEFGEGINIGNDAEVYIYGASKLSSLGDLSNLYTRRITAANASRLKELKIGNRAQGYQNTRLTSVSLDNCTLLETLVLSNCSSLGTGSQEGDIKVLNLSNCNNLKELYLEGTKLTGCTLSQAGYLETMVLPATFEELKITNQPNLDLGSIMIEDKKLSEITEDKYTDYLASIRTLNIQSIGSAIESTLSPIELFKKFCRDDSNLTTVNMNNIIWNDCKIEDLIKLYTDYGMENITLVGDCYIIPSEDTEYDSKLDVYYLDGAKIADIRSHINGLNMIFADNVFVKSNVYFHNQPNDEYPEGQILNTSAVISQKLTGTSVSSPKVNPFKASDTYYDYQWITDGWSLQANATQVDDNALNNILGDRHLYPVFNRVVKQYTIRFISGGTELYSTTVPSIDDSIPGNPVPTRVTFDISKVNPDYLDGNGNPLKLDAINTDNYLFIGWLPDFASIEYEIDSDTDFTAQFDFNYYELTLDDFEYEIQNDGLKVTKINPINQSVIKFADEYEIDSQDYSIKYLTENTFGELVYNGLTPLGPAPNTLRTYIEAVDLSNTEITDLPDYCFRFSSNLTHIQLPESLKTIGIYAFASTNLMQLDIPNQIQKIGYYICSELTLDAIYVRGTPQTMSSSAAGGLPFSNCIVDDIYVQWNAAHPININSPWGAKTISGEAPKIHYAYF